MKTQSVTALSFLLVGAIYGVQGIAAMAQTSSQAKPDAPSRIEIQRGDRQLGLSWRGVQGATSYNIYRATVRGGEEANPTKTGIDDRRVWDTGLSNGTTYYYRLSAVNANGEGPLSKEAWGTPMERAGVDVDLISADDDVPDVRASDGKSPVPVTAVPAAKAKEYFPLIHPNWSAAHETQKRGKTVYYDDLPLLIVSRDEADNSVTSYNWGRLTYGAGTVYGGGGIKGFISLVIPNRAQRAYVYMIDTQTNTVDLQHQPGDWNNLALTYRMKVAHYGELPAFNPLNLSSWSSVADFQFSVSTNNFGGQSADEGSRTVFALGPSLEVGPYFNIGGGLAIQNGSESKISTGVTFNVSLDPSLMGKIFK